MVKVVPLRFQMWSAIGCQENIYFIPEPVTKADVSAYDRLKSMFVNAVQCAPCSISNKISTLGQKASKMDNYQSIEDARIIPFDTWDMQSERKQFLW